MPIKEKQTCSMHTNEKEKSGTCCRIKEGQEEAEQLTYEHNVRVAPTPTEIKNDWMDKKKVGPVYNLVHRRIR